MHPADAEPLLEVLQQLKASGNSLFVVEHDMNVIRRTDWIIDIRPAAGEDGGHVVHSGPGAVLEQVNESATGEYLFERASAPDQDPRKPGGWLRLRGITRHNLSNLSVQVPMGVMTAVTGVSAQARPRWSSRCYPGWCGTGLR